MNAIVKSELKRFKTKTVVSKMSNVKKVKKVLKKLKNLKFEKKLGQADLSQIDNVFEKNKEDFLIKTYKDHADALYADEKIVSILNNYVANGVQFDPKDMGVPCYTPLGLHFTSEETQRLIDSRNIHKIGRKFRFDFYGIVHCVKKSYLDTYEDVDAMHRTTWLLLAILAGCVKGYDESNWMDFPIPSIVYHTDDPTFPGLLALMLNGEGQTPWGDIDFLRIHCNNHRLYGSIATEDMLAYQKVMSCKLDGHSIPVAANHKDAKKLGASTHIDAIMQNDNMERFRFVQSQNLKWWPMEDRDSGMWGFYGNQFDHYKNFKIPLTGKNWEERDHDMHAIIQMLFENLTGLRGVVTAALKQMSIHSKGAFKKGKSDNTELAIVEILYKDYYGGPHLVSGAAGNYLYRDPNTKEEYNIVDALRDLKDKNGKYIYRSKIDDLKPE